MYKEATLVFDNATEIDGAFHEPLIHLACLVRPGDTEKAARLCARMLDGTRKRHHRRGADPDRRSGCGPLAGRQSAPCVTG